MIKRCSVCILPVGLPGLNLDQNDKCNCCREFEASYSKKANSLQSQNKDKFEAIIKRLKGKGKYDCLVGLSGGKDSSYVLSVLIKKYNMKVLAFNFNNGFQHNQAIRNIENLVNKLGVDLIIYKPNQHMMRKLFRAFLLRAGEFCTPCNMLIDATSYRIARQHGIKVIMSGESEYLAPGLEGVSISRYYDRKYYLEVAKSLVTHRERECYIGPPYPFKAIRRLLGKGIYIISVPKFLKPSFMEIHDVLKEIGWEQPAGTIQHGDCLLNPIKDYIYYKKWGCSEVTGLYSALIRKGEISREEGLRKATAEEYSKVPAILPEFLNTIGITESEFKEALKRDFRKIPNLRKNTFFRIAKNIMERIDLTRGKI